MADNLHRQFDHIEDLETERPQTTNYQDYQGLNSNSIKLQDMIFFGRISDVYKRQCIFFYNPFLPCTSSS